VCLPTPDAARATEVVGSQTITAPAGDSSLSRRETQLVLSKEAALVIIQTTTNAGKAFLYLRENPKQGASRARFEACKVATSFAQLEAFRTQRFPDGRRVIEGSCTTHNGNFVHDVRHRLVA
jgi:hypothetical protein